MGTLKIILIHGNGGGTGTDNWFPYVKNNLEAKGYKVISETMPDNVLARESQWLPFLKDKLEADENTILVGHSSGAVAAMRFAENNKIFGSVLVGACYTDLGDEDEKASGYYSRPWQWDKIKANQNWIIQFASTDDSYIPIEEARYIHERLDSEYHESNHEGHFGEDKGKTEFPELVGVVTQKLNVSQVADVVIVDGDKVLLVQQRKESAHGLWSYPGGRVEDGETLEQAVVREVKEELGTDLLHPKFTKTYSITTPRGALDINTFTGELSGNISLKDDELVAYRWCTVDELENMKASLRGSCVIDQARDALHGQK